MIKCEMCISLPMCKGKLGDGDFLDLMGLTDECPDLKIFMKAPKSIIDHSKFIDERIKVLRNSLLKNINFYQYVRMSDRHLNGKSNSSV